MQWVIGWKRGGDFQVGDDARAKTFGQHDAGLPGLDVARDAAGEDDRIFRRPQQRRRRLDGVGIGRAFDRGHESSGVDRGDGFGQFGFLQFDVEIDVSRAARRGIGNPRGAQHRLAGSDRRARLIVPFGVAAHQRALIARGVDPFDPGPAFRRVIRAGGADDEHRHAVAPGVEDRHGGMHQADVGVHRRRHRLAGDLGIAMRDRDRAFLVQAQQHLRLFVAEIIHQAVVQAAIARAGVERDIGNVEGADRVGDHVAAERGGIDAGGDGAVDGSRVGQGGRGLGWIGMRHAVWVSPRFSP